MGRSYRIARVALVVVAVGALVGGLSAPAALAVDPPGDVAFDATVTFELPAATHAGVSLEDAVVKLSAYRAGGEPFQELELTATTEPTVVFKDVARAADGAPDVLLDARFDWALDATDDVGCQVTSGQSGDVKGIVSVDGLVLKPGNGASSSVLDCTKAPDLTDGVISVTFVDAETLLAVADAGVTVSVRADDDPKTTSVGPAADGMTLTGTTDSEGVATIEGVPYRPHDGPGLVLDVTAHKSTSWSDSASGCKGGDSWDAKRLDVPAGKAVTVAFTGDEQSVASSLECGPKPTPGGGVLGTTGTPRPRATPPATDTPGAVASPSNPASAGLALATLVGLALAVAARTSRFGTRRR